MPPANPYTPIFEAEYWGKHGAPVDLIRQLRQEHPIYWFEGGAFEPFWLLTRYQDVRHVDMHSKLFLAAPRAVVHRPQGYQSPHINLSRMDPPEHTKHRLALQSWFTPRAIRRFENRMSEIVKDLIDSIDGRDSCEFCNEVGVRLPIKLICELLGIPKDQEAYIESLTSEIFGSDPQSAEKAIATGIEYCRDIVKARRSKPGEDFASTIANALIDAESLPEGKAAAHIMTMITAGHETTGNAINSGVLAFIRHPEEFAKLRNNPALLDSAVNEILRFVTPTTCFVRTAAEDTEIGEVKIAKGQDVCMHYFAANRDESQFDEPDKFSITREPNRHLAFGSGPHGCIGQMLARIEMKALFGELARRIESMTLDGTPEYTNSFWVTGLKKLPLKLSFR